MKCKCCDNRLIVSGNQVSIVLDRRMLDILNAQARAGSDRFEVGVEVDWKIAMKFYDILRKEN